MVTGRRIVLEALSPVIALARSTLADLEPREVPAPLRRVAAVQGGRLAPPLQSALISEIDTSDWLRAKIAERLGDSPDPVAVAFLEREDGWWRIVADRVAEVATRDMSRSAERADRARRDAEESVEEARRRLEAADREHDEVLGRLRGELAEARAAARRPDRDQIHDSLLADLEQAREDLAEARRATTAAEGDLAAANRRLVRVRRGRSPRPASQGGSLPRDPIDLARLLDHQASLSERTLDAAAVHAPKERAPLQLPGGMSPEAPEAVAWALALDPPGRLIVDGYNVLFHIDDRRGAAGETRRRLNDGLRRLRRQSGGRAAITVVYDSSLGGGRRGRSAVDGIEIRFAEEGVTADEEIVRLAMGERRVVVVSSDRDVQRRSSDAGAVVLWSEALVASLTR